MLVIQDDLDNIAVQRQNTAAAQDQLAKLRLPVIQLFKKL